MPRWIVPLLMGVVMASSFATMPAFGKQVPVFFVLFGIASVAYLIAVWHCEYVPLTAIVIAAAVFRLSLLFSMPMLSDDIYRYVWDGHVQWSGINPYRFAPAAQELVSVRDALIFPQINHPELPTIYPPLAQMAFWVGYGISGSVLGIKVLLVCADLIAGWLIVCLLRHSEQRTQWVLIYYWHPLIVIEIAGNGHIESLGIVALLAALYLFLKGRDRLALSALGGAILVKFLPLVFLPYFVRRKGWQPTNSSALLMAPCVVLLGYLPYAWAGASVFGSLSTYAQHWSFNSAVFDVLFLLCGNGQIARGIIGLIFLSVVLWLIWKRIPLLHSAYLTVAGFILLTPTLHPWYVVWLIPFLVFFRHPPWIAFSLLVVLSYHILIQYQACGIWEEAGWIQWAEYGGLALVGIPYLLLMHTEILTKIERFFNIHRPI